MFRNWVHARTPRLPSIDPFFAFAMISVGAALVMVVADIIQIVRHLG